jgi:DNA polymerase epsilon subunit 2
MRTLDALKKVFGVYNDLSRAERPQVFVMMGNFVRKAIISGGGRAGSIEYKEYFDSLAVVLSDFPALLQYSTFVFVPGDNDPWASAFSAGAASTIPRQPIPELFTSRIKRAFATANSELGRSNPAEPVGEALWTSNPTRLTWFGPVHDIAIFRDDISGRLRRTAVNTKPDDVPDITMHEALDGPTGNAVSIAPDEETDPVAQSNATKLGTGAATSVARKLVKTILDQGTISPFPLPLRPVLWDHGSALQLYPLPTALILADAEASPFCMTYEGCHVMNPGRLTPEGDIPTVRWVEYDVLRNRGKVREERY